MKNCHKNKDNQGQKQKVTRFGETARRKKTRATKSG